MRLLIIKELKMKSKSKIAIQYFLITVKKLKYFGHKSIHNQYLFSKFKSETYIFKRGLKMPKFIVVHPIPRKQMEQMAEIPPEQNRMIINLRKASNYDAYWLRSWAVLDHEKLYCEWNAKDADSIKKVWNENVKGIEIESIAELQVIDSEDFRGK